MKHIKDKLYLTADEAAARLGCSADDVFMLTLESAQPESVCEGDELFYLAEDVERLQAAHAEGPWHAG